MTTMSRRGLPAHVCGEQVRMALMEARPSALTLAQLVSATKMSLSQVRRGLVYLREVLASQHGTPLIWTPGEGYRLSPELDDLIAYARAQFRRNLTQISRLITATIEPHYSWMPDDDWIRLVREQLGGARATFELLKKLNLDEPVTRLRGPKTARRTRR
ncbi:hypothetical protein BBK82_07455 [Lentzea guizhouensis]|uniref:RacP protein n=1 Tax=Lentzea guizhouensis TaxID=1586287 RepID=A0A1B2HDY6_9PSEU|nr:hypothetical protein [Lentzea guizhouensis]ANZ35940.1 hypothetical protein BBK82_07455 [Lentzea guizhouensis]